MNTVEINNELAVLERQRKKFEDSLAIHTEERDKALAEPSFRQRDVDEASHEMAYAERRLRDLDLRMSALRRQLPTPKQKKEAKTEAAACVERVESARIKFEKTWPKFFAALQAAEELGREVAAARMDARVAEVQLKDLAIRFGLDVTMPEALTADNVKTAYLIGSVLRDLSIGDPDSTVERDLAALR